MAPNQPSCAVASNVAELQGLYGPFQFSEKLLQKIWLRGDFDVSVARLTDGRPLEVLDPGRWNLLGGPDFRGARLRLGRGPEVTGDVEIHVHATDWVAHAHASDPAYDEVVLHVVLFPPDAARPTRGRDGVEIPVLVLLPLLHHDLEQFAAEEAVEALAGRMGDAPPEELVALAAAELTGLLRTHARARWRQKVHFARLRIQRLGWTAACHHSALEILGYRFNRAPMLRVAARWPLTEWGKGVVRVEAVLEAERGRWSLQGVRPANHPCNRLRQYAAWATARPAWPEELALAAADWPEVGPAAETRAARRVHGLVGLRQECAALCGGAIGGPRLDNVVCDGILPLLAARENRGRESEGVWFHWWPGDQPPLILRHLRLLGVVSGRNHPACHGAAQGLVGWMLEQEMRGRAGGGERGRT